MVEWCATEFTCEEQTGVLVDLSVPEDISDTVRTCDLKRLILSQHNIGPWKVGITSVAKHRKKNSAPPATCRPLSSLPPLPFSHHNITSCCYPSPFLLDYCDHTQATRGHDNSAKLPELKVKPITLPFLGSTPNRSVSCSGPSTPLTRKLCLQNMSNTSEQQQLLEVPSAKLPLLRFTGGENVIGCYKKKRMSTKSTKTDLSTKQRTLGSLTRSCSLVSLTVANKMFPPSTMRIETKKMTISEKIKSKNKFARPKLPKL